ncbi:MAG TPA: RNA-binding S4 domain-containing protein [Gammaproteobacteria bacterium]|nr:RNA-binding S4 domain-containing protein [Gammaproteobacteria bacterium]
MKVARRGEPGGAAEPAEDADDRSEQRIDRWLWCARFYKTRSAAADAVKGGHVHVNGLRVKPAREVKVGDRLSITRDDSEREITVLAIPERRGPAPEAARCYAESEASIARRREQAERRRALDRAPTEGRPDKRTRRLLRAKRHAE